MEEAILRCSGDLCVSDREMSVLKRRIERGERNKKNAKVRRLIVTRK